MYAIVGVAAQFPSGQHSSADLDYEEFWEFLLKGAQATEDLGGARLQPNPFESADLSKLPPKGAFLKDMADFDYPAFGISSNDARVMPHSARRLMELSFHALRDAGIQTRGQPIGCFMSGNNDSDQDAMSTDGSLAYLPSAMANRVSYAFNLTGPSMTIDTACSSSLTSLHLAISAIKNGDCTAAIVGAAQSNRRLTEWWNYYRSHFLSPNGTCRPFDDQADGFSRGEGAIVIVVKDLQKALEDRDHIYCVVTGSFHGTTGSEMPINVPNGATHRTCISQAYARAKKEPTEADYVELHITGTTVGDPIEANAAGQVFSRENTGIRVGSVKGNIGHLECAAFLASLVKACHIFDKGVIPPTVNFATPNRSISWDKNGLRVVTEPTPLKAKGQQPLISISSAGIGGSTGHVLLQGPPNDSPDTSRRPAQETPVLFLVGGLTPNAAQEIYRQISALPDDRDILIANAVIASRQARQLPWRSFLIREHDNVFTADVPRPILVPKKTPKLAFVFSGQGPHNADMGHQLFQQYPVFRNTVLELDEVHKRVMGFSFLNATGLFSRQISDPRILQRKWPVILTLPALVMVHIGVFELLKSIGVLPDCLLGHSAGETALVYASGAGPKAMAMEIALARGRSMTCTEGMDGAMAVIACSAEDCQALIDLVHENHGIDPNLEISCYNTPDSVVVSGQKDLVEEVISFAQGRDIFAQKIHTLVPGHSAYIDHCREEHDRLLRDIFSRYPGPHVPAIPVFSTCREGQIVKEFAPEYFWDNARNPVYFSSAISHVLSQNDRSTTTFMEISPHPVLSGAIADHGVLQTHIFCPMQRFPREAYDPNHEALSLLSTIGELAIAGYDSIDLSGLYGASRSNKTQTKHPLQRLRVSPFKTYSAKISNHNSPTPLLSFLPELNSEAIALFSQHRVGNVPIVPGTGWIEMALEAGASCLWDVEFLSFFSLEQDPLPALRFERNGRNKWSITFTRSSPSTHQFPANVVVATGCLGVNLSHKLRPKKLDLNRLQARLGPVDIQGLHEAHKGHLAFGASFNRLHNVFGNPSEILAEIRAPSMDERLSGYVVHPAVLDACVRVISYKELLQDWGTGPWFPKRFAKFMVYPDEDDTSTSWFSYIRLNSWTQDLRSYNILVTNDQGYPICEFHDFRLERMASETLQRKPFQLVFEPIGQDEQAYEQLFSVLDFLALNRIRRTLELPRTCGNRLDRTRYLERIKKALENRKNGLNAFKPSEILEQEQRWPAFFEVTRRIEAVHPDILQSSQPAISTLYADELMHSYYAEHNRLTRSCEEMAKQLNQILGVIKNSGKRVVRILEIGVGTGTLTRHLIPILEVHDQVVIQYTATDTSQSLVTDLARSVQLDYLAPKVYDITSDPIDQGFTPASFDIILAYHVLHVAPNLRTLCDRLHNLLVPGGFILAAEVDNTSWLSKPGALWMDFTFGSFAEWFGYQDDRDHCSISPSSWNTLLKSSGFGNFTSVVGKTRGLEFILACQKIPLSDDDTIERAPNFTLFHYRAGQEEELQRCMKTFNPTTDGALCLWTNSKYDGDSAMGLVLALSKEFHAWTIWLAIFDIAIDLVAVEDAVKQNHPHFLRERTIRFSPDGNPSIPRVVPLPSVPTASERDLLSLPRDHITVEVAEHSSEGGFLGRVVQSKDTGIPEQTLVAGLSPGVGTHNILTCHSGTVTALQQLNRRILPYLPAILLQFHVLGLSRFMYPGFHHPTLRVLLALRNIKVKEALYNLLRLSPGVEIVESQENSETFLDVVVTDQDTLERDPALEQCVGTNGRLVTWAPLLLKDDLQREPWLLRHVLGSGIKGIDLPASAADLVAVPRTPRPTRSLNSGILFDSNKAYLLIGGIGGIGIHLAHWLYRNGARHIYLTSRRGRETVAHTNEHLLPHKLRHLEQRADLDLRLVACDASNARETSAFLASVDLPIGGCFFMPLVLADALFLRQTPETMDVVRKSKCGAFEVFSSLCNVRAMDFFVAFSSVSALWGDVGQSNYASACAALDGMMSDYPNAFSILVPAILDAGYLLHEGAVGRLDIPGVEEWGMGAEALCEYIRDGIARVRMGSRPSIYIPGLDFNTVSKIISLPPLCHSAIPLSAMAVSGSTQENTPVEKEGNCQNLQEILDSSREIVMAGLGLDKSGAFCPDIPFLDSGLDSIGAARLSRQLRPYIEVSQTDLLLGLCWNDLEVKIKQKLTIQVQSSSSATNDIEACLQLVLSALGLESAANFSPDIPFVDCGLDSIRATQLSRRLKPYVQVSHMDLLLDLNWRRLEAQIRQMSASTTRQGITVMNTVEQCHNLVLDGLGIEAASFSANLPFINAGLDSIRATRLSRQLKPYVEVSQTDLLLGMTWEGLEEKIRSANSRIMVNESERLAIPRKMLNGTNGMSGATGRGGKKELIVSFTKLRDAPGGPVVFALPGSTGTLSTITPLLKNAAKGTSTLWAVHFDLSPLSGSPPSLRELVKEIHDGMTERYPSGPLKIIAVSGSGTMAFVLTKALESEGREVLDVSFIDHFPTLFYHEAYGRSLEQCIQSSNTDPDVMKRIDIMAEQGVEVMLQMQEVDPFVSRTQTKSNGLSGMDSVRHLETAQIVTVMTISHLIELHRHSQSRSTSVVHHMEVLARWMASIKASLLVVVADKGFNHVVKTPWTDFGVQRLLSYKENVEVLHIDEGHFAVVGSEKLAQKLSL